MTAYYNEWDCGEINVSLVKRCSVCKEEKSLDCFHNQKSKKSGKASACKQCASEKERLRNSTESRKKSRSESYLSRMKDPVKREVKLEKERKRKSLPHVKERNKFLNKKWHSKPENIAKRKARVKWLSSTEEGKNVIRSYAAKQRLNPQNKISSNLRRRVLFALKGERKPGSVISLLGCSLEYFKEYIEGLFVYGMTWDNYGKKGWHLDHIKPLSKFDLTDYEDFKKSCHYTNIQPLWAIDNMKKGATCNIAQSVPSVACEFIKAFMAIND